MPSRRLLQLAAIGTAAGVFSGLFGVGGGTVVVPLLVIWLGFGEHEATGTSLVAIVLIAAVAAGTHGIYGNVDVEKALELGLPATAGVVAGTALQQKVKAEYLSFAFAALLVATAISLLV
jgi:uncharacterized membrane protein YfcA